MEAEEGAFESCDLSAAAATAAGKSGAAGTSEATYQGAVATSKALVAASSPSALQDDRRNELLCLRLAQRPHNLTNTLAAMRQYPAANNLHDPPR